MDNSVIIQLTGIDNAARAVVDKVGEEQKKLAEQYRAKTEAYDRKIDEETELRLRKLRSDIESQNLREIEQLEADTGRILEVINKKYADQVDVRADEIVGRILKA